MSPYQISELHSYSRKLEGRFREAGAVFDKKLLRHNDVVAVGLHWARLGPVTSRTFSIAKEGVRQSLLACVKIWMIDAEERPEPMYDPGRGPLSMINTWMETV